MGRFVTRLTAPFILLMGVVLISWMAYRIGLKEEDALILAVALFLSFVGFTFLL